MISRGGGTAATWNALTDWLNMDWQKECTERLVALQDEAGGWPYRAHGTSCSEPTALACLALMNHVENREAVRHGLRWLSARQQEDGGVTLQEGMTEPRWCTALACLAWQSSLRMDSQFAPNAAASVEWLVRNEGKSFRSNAAIYGHNTELKGWSWVAGTHSWIEPTAYAVLALRAAGKTRHARAREGVSLLIDRAMPHGGWNYGNSRMFGRELRAFPAQTGLALAALSGEPWHECVTKSLDFLRTELPRIRTPFSLGWGLMGVTAWGARPIESEEWLAQCAERVARRPADSTHDAMLLLAGTASSALLPIMRETIHAS